jgi:hypothetical protein
MKINLVKGIPWIPLGSLGGPLGVHGRSVDQNSAVAAAGSLFLQKSASRCSPSHPTSRRRPGAAPTAASGTRIVHSVQ